MHYTNQSGLHVAFEWGCIATGFNSTQSPRQVVRCFSQTGDCLLVEALPAAWLHRLDSYATSLVAPKDKANIISVVLDYAI